MATAPRARHRADPPARSPRTAPVRRRRTGRSLGAPLLLALVLTISSLALTTPSDAADDVGSPGRAPGSSVGLSPTAGR